MSISEQVKELREVAEMYEGLDGGKILSEAADTIESLSAKQENAYYVKRNGKDDVIVSIMYNKADNKYHFVNLSKNHICACGFETTEEAIADMEQRKNNGSICDFYLIERSAEDCGGGWIYCGDGENLPEESGYYLVTYHEWSNGEFLPKFDDTYVKRLHYQKSEQFIGWNFSKCVDKRAEDDMNREVLAWQPLPEPYHEP